jgi:hypothetical protein
MAESFPGGYLCSEKELSETHREEVVAASAGFRTVYSNLGGLNFCDL